MLKIKQIIASCLVGLIYHLKSKIVVIRFAGKK